MTAKNEATKTPTLDDSIEPTPRPNSIETMKAIVQDDYGTEPDDVLRLAEIARPTIGVGEVLVRVKAMSSVPGVWRTS
jgi:hypothetical protein